VPVAADSMDFNCAPIVVVPSYRTTSKAHSNQRAVVISNADAQHLTRDGGRPVVAMPTGYAVKGDLSANGHKFQSHGAYFSIGLDL